MCTNLNLKCARTLCLVLVLVTSISIGVVDARKHHLSLQNDERRLIHITTFGFLKGGSLEVKIHNFSITPNVNGSQQPILFTVDRTLNDGINPYSHNMENSCAVNRQTLEPIDNDDSFSSIRLSLDFAKSRAIVRCSTELRSHVKVFKTRGRVPVFSKTWKTQSQRKEFTNPMTQRQKRNGTIGLYDNDDEYSSSADLDSESGTIPGVLPVSDDGKSNFKILASSTTATDKVNAANSLQKDDSSEKENSGEVSDVSKSVSQKSQDDPQGQQPQKSLLDPKIGDYDLGDDSHNFSDPAIPIGTGDVNDSCERQELVLNATQLADGTISYSLTFVVYIAGEDCEGLYNLYFHNCANAPNSRVTLNMSYVEENQDSEEKNFLSAGEMPLPALYFMMSVLFFTAGCFWVVILKKSRKETGVSVFKIHYLMASLVFAKSLSLLFHSINYHYIQIVGTHVEGWAVLYYITHLLKGALLFLTILLIGTGYAFVKHLLSDKEKKLFMVVIPLQVLANVAQIILEESEEGEVVHTTWKVIFVSLDLLCCGAILFPVVWSIRHLQEASQTDGKAATNLRKLKLFRHFYIMVVCYIYFTRIIVQMLLRITVPFQYEWLDVMFTEMTTFIFFVLTGYKFRPAANNPYLELAHDSDEEADMDIALTESGLTEGLSKRGFKPKKKTLKEIVLFDPNEEDTDDDEEVLLEKREASHDFD